MPIDDRYQGRQAGSGNGAGEERLSGYGHTQTFVGSECEHNDYIIIIIIMIGLPFAEFGRNAIEAKVIRL